MNIWRSITVYTHGKMLSIVLYNKNSNGSLKDFGAWKKKNKSADVIWRGLTSSVCACPLIDHGQQPMKPMKMHTEVTLWYKWLYM